MVSRTFTGAWIETSISFFICKYISVAPLRVRGLKQQKYIYRYKTKCRTFTGAWIETPIESGTVYDFFVAPLQVRGLKLKKVLQ